MNVELNSNVFDDLERLENLKWNTIILISFHLLFTVTKQYFFIARQSFSVGC